MTDASAARIKNLLRTCIPMSREEEQLAFKALAQAETDGERDVWRGRIIRANLRFAFLHSGRRASSCGLTIAQAFSAASAGVCIAVNRFNYKRELKFISYAVWWIDAEINKAAMFVKNEVYVPANIHSDDSIYRKKNRKAINAGEMPPHLPSIPTLTRMVTSNSSDESDLMSDNPEVVNAGYFTPADTVDEAINRETAREILLKTLKTLPERERIIVESVYGLDGHEPKTLAEIGLVVGLTRERVRQLRDRALSRLASPIHTKNLSAIRAEIYT